MSDLSDNNCTKLRDLQLNHNDTNFIETFMIIESGKVKEQKTGMIIFKCMLEANNMCNLTVNEHEKHSKKSTTR